MPNRAAGHHVRLGLPSHMLALAGAAFALLLAATTHAADWSGIEGGNLHHNASPVDVAPQTLHRAWTATFDDPVVATDTPAHGLFGSRNLVTLGSHLAVVAKDKSIPGTPRQGYLTLLDLATGRLENTLQAAMKKGRNHINYYAPTGMYDDSNDAGAGLQMLAWDPASATLYLKSGGDGGLATACMPLANLDAWQPGTSQLGVKAFGDSDAWYPHAPNATWYFELDPDANTILCTNPGHFMATGGRYIYIANKRTGQRAAGDDVHATPLEPPAYTNKPEALNPFGYYGGVLAAHGRIFMMGPGDDNDNDGHLGLCKLSGTAWNKADKSRDAQYEKGYNFHMDQPDQGLYLWAFNTVWPDRAHITMTPAFKYRFTSPPALHGPASAQSYWETDGLYRNKAFLVDGRGVWAAWKPSRAGGVQLIHADDAGSHAYDLAVARDVPGHEIWPHLSLADVAGSKYLVYFAGNCFHRDYLDTTPPYWATPGSFSAEKPPLGPAELAVFNATTGQLAWTYDLSAHYPSLTPNHFFFTYDRSQLVVAGRWAYVGWVDLTGQNARLDLLAFDLTAPTPQPVLHVEDLNFPVAGNQTSYLTDLIAVDGRLLALVTRCNMQDMNDWSWTAQYVLALQAGPPAP